MDVEIQHWMVGVARAAGLDDPDGLRIPAYTEPSDAWDRVALRTGATPDELAGLVATHFGLPVADLERPGAHAHRILPGRVARRLNVLPLRCSDRHVEVATSDPVSLEAEREITRVTARTVRFQVAPPARLGPAVEAAYAHEQPPHVLPPLDAEGRAGRRILVVEDDPDTRLLLRTGLQQDGFRVAEAGDGATALATLAAATDDPFALATLDLRLPDMPGLEVLRALRARPTTATLPVVVATGMDDPDVEMELFRAGADDFVVKPVDPPRLALRIRAVLRRHGAGDGAP